MKKYLVGFVLGVTLTFGTIFLIPKPIAQTPTPTPQIIYRDVIKEVEVIRPTDLETVAKNVKNSAVMIYSYKGNTTSQGSGVIVGDSYILTAKHVVDGFDKIDIFTDDSKYGVSGTVYYIDPILDVAIIRADTGLPSVTLGDSDKLTDGEKLVSITSPKGTKNIIEECTYSGTMEAIAPNDIGITDTIMTHGSSGGGIFNRNSELVAMNFFGAQNAKGIIGAIPINDLKPILQKLK